MGGNDERRRALREPLTLKVAYQDATELVADYTENISAGGIFVLTERQLPNGAEVRLVLSFPGLIKPLPIRGTVRWTRSDPPEERGVGVEFDLAEPGPIERLGELIQRIAGGDPELVRRHLRVLVVDYNPHAAALIRDGLNGGARRDLGGAVFDCTTVNNGRDAFAALRAQPFDVLIVDMHLPVLDGAHFIMQLRSEEQLRHLPIVAVAAGGPDVRIAALAAGADFFLAKPMRLVDIIETMRRLLDASQFAQ